MLQQIWIPISNSQNINPINITATLNTWNAITNTKIPFPFSFRPLYFTSKRTIKGPINPQHKHVFQQQNYATLSRKKKHGYASNSKKSKRAHFLFFLQAFFLPPVARLLCIESLEIPVEEEESPFEKIPNTDMTDRRTTTKKKHTHLGRALRWSNTLPVSLALA